MPLPSPTPPRAFFAARTLPSPRVALSLATLLGVVLLQGCGLRQAFMGPTTPVAATAAEPARDYGTSQQDSLTVRGGLPPRAGDVPAGAAVPPIPPRPPLMAEAAPAEPPAEASPASQTTTTTVTTEETPAGETPTPETAAETAPPVTPDAPGILVAGTVRPQSATGAFTSGRGGCEALAASTLAREDHLGFTTPPVELLTLGGMHLGLARCARGAGDAALARARARRAGVVLAQADALEIATGNLEGLADTRSQLGHAAYEAGEYNEARRLLRDAIARYAALGRTTDANRDLRLLAVLGPVSGR